MLKIKQLEEIRACMNNAVMMSETPTLRTDLCLLQSQIEQMYHPSPFNEEAMENLKTKYQNEIFLSADLFPEPTSLVQSLEKVSIMIQNEDIPEGYKLLALQTIKLMCHFELQATTVRLQAKNIWNQLNVTQTKRSKSFLDLAEQMAAIAKEESMNLGIETVFSVIDSGGNLVLFHRMDKALLASIGISMNKAYTALFFQRPSHELAPLVQPGGMLDGILQTNPKIVPFGGGFLLRDSEEIIGAIGVSGGTVEEDIKIANHVLAFFKRA